MNDERNGWDAARAACRPCRGSGRLLSMFGGTEHQLTCPWCTGSGGFVSGHDAQQSPAEQAGAQGSSAQQHP